MSLPSMRLDGQVVIVTGAGGQLGRIAARAFAEAGADVVAVGRTLATCEATASKVRELGRRALALSVDITAMDQVLAMVDRVRNDFGRIDVLLNNAVRSYKRTLLDGPVEEWSEVIDVNIKLKFPPLPSEFVFAR